MKIVCYDDAGRPAIGVQFEDGVLPTGYSDLRTFIEAGYRLGSRGIEAQFHVQANPRDLHQVREQAAIGRAVIKGRVMARAGHVLPPRQAGPQVTDEDLQVVDATDGPGLAHAGASLSCFHPATSGLVR